MGSTETVNNSDLELWIIQEMSTGCDMTVGLIDEFRSSLVWLLGSRAEIKIVIVPLQVQCEGCSSWSSGWAWDTE